MVAQGLKAVLIINLIIMDHSRMIQAFRFIEILKYDDGSQLMSSAKLCPEAVPHPSNFVNKMHIPAVAVFLDRVSIPSPIAIDILMVRNGEGQSSHVLVFSVNFERHISTHITTSIECYLNS